jgi:dTDP-4-dehydrorhamnose reductase
MRLLITGASGLLGGRLAECFAQSFEVIAGHSLGAPPIGLPARRFDITSLTEVRSALEAVEPEAVLHGAALADADRCQREPGLAEAVNVTASETLARLCQAAGVRLVALSTDLVFDGRTGHYGEDARATPLLVYGRTKLAGEDAILREAPGAAIARVALVVGRGFGSRPTASEAVAWRLAAGQPVRLFTNQYRSPVDPESLASALAALLRGTQTGRFHLGGRERVSRWELGLRVARQCGLCIDLIEPVTRAAAAHGAPRPPDVSLESSRAERELGWQPRPLDEAILCGRAAASH